MHRFSIMIVICVGLFLHDTLRANLPAAEWARVGGTHKYDRYVDMTTIGVSGQRVTLWTLRDFRIERAIPRGPYRSLTIKRQYDCSQRKSRPLRAPYYPDGMAQGLVLYAAPATREWSRVVPGSDDDVEMKVACRQAHRG
ncbi:MAG: hypothetical protein E8D52_06820 [Nitrospira sp.]|nr:MAG: hypothetical protein E8D52_06820 [Nitrospira sp.]